MSIKKVLPLQILLLALPLGLLLLSGCEINRLNSARDLYESELYAGAIQALDDLIEVGKNGAIVTRAELIRSDCYLELGKSAIERNNRSLAISFFKLANSEAADVELTRIYSRMAEEAYRSGDLPLAKKYMDDIIREIPDSPAIPQVMLRRISIYMEEYQDRNSTWEDYKFLYDNFPNNPYEIQARYFVGQFIDTKIEYAAELLEQGYYQESLSELFELSRYPVVDAQQINHLISDVYQAQAEEYIDEQDYLKADQLFRIAVQYNPAKQSEIDDRLEGITSLYVQKGDSLLEDRDFEGALLHYNKTFEIIPNYAPAREAIRRLQQIQEDIRRAREIFAEAELLEATQKHAEALQLYNQAIALDPHPEYQARARIMQNLLEAEKDPTTFARRIINQYRGGVLLRRIAAKREEILQSHDENDIRDSGWKILLSTGQYKYEARYDLLTPTETFLYVWQINLRDRTVIPLNKLSEALMQ
jgi:tetratricopeptide (TPR) repeat protein